MSASWNPLKIDPVMEGENSINHKVLLHPSYFLHLINTAQLMLAGTNSHVHTRLEKAGFGLQKEASSNPYVVRIKDSQWLFNKEHLVHALPLPLKLVTLGKCSLFKLKCDRMMSSLERGQMKQSSKGLGRSHYQ